MNVHILEPNLVKYLVGSKTDLESSRQVSLNTVFHNLSSKTFIQNLSYLKS